MTHMSKRPVDWDDFVSQYQTRLYRTAFGILGNAQAAEDAVQDTFLKYLERAPDFSVPAQEAAWLTKVTVNHCLSDLRSPWRRRVDPLPPDLPCQARQELEELYQLPPKDRAVLHLYYYEGYSTGEIARMLRLSPGSIRSRLSRARQKLKTLLEEGG